MNKLIYIIDDQAAIRDMLKTLLKCGDPTWEVKGFGEPGELIAAVAERPPDMVISDFSMPGMKGTEVQDKIREISPSTIRILLSGSISNLSRIASAHQFIANILARRKHCPDQLETAALDGNYLKSIGAAEIINDSLAQLSPL
jgi:DNA-binding NtrC family response regulator